jgi:hypothetical protein
MPVLAVFFWTDSTLNTDGIVGLCKGGNQVFPLLPLYAPSSA